MHPVTRSSLPDQVFGELLTGVIEGRYAPGERLPSQRALAADLGVNMASLREAIKRLEQLRLLEVRQGDAMRVRDWRRHGGLDVLAYGAFADPAVAGALFEARRMLLRDAALLAAERRTAGQAEALAELAAAFAGAANDATAQAIDLAFMGTLIEAAGNLVFTLIINSIRGLYVERLEHFEAIVRDRPALAPLYARAAKAVADGDAEGAADAIDLLAGAQQEAMA